MITVRFDGVEVEIDPISIAVSASQQFRIFRRRGIFRYLRGDIYLVSSNLFALGQGTEVQVGDTRLTAAPLLKPYPDGSAKLVNSGFSVTGIYDSFGQTELGSALARASRSFVITSDSDPEIDREANLVCFGSPSSNAVSNDIYESLNSVTNQCFQWTSGYNCFTLLDSEYCGGDQGAC